MYLVKEKINLGEILENIDFSSGKDGSIIVFTGVVRRDRKRNGTFVKKIFYDAYEPMAEKEIQKIVDEAKRNFKVDEIIVKHRIGYVDVGEISFLVIVLSPHREEGFNAIKFIIDEVKRKAPIWKKEILSNGEEIWKQTNNNNNEQVKEEWEKRNKI